MSERIICCNCDKDCADHHWGCDEDVDSSWCDDCWPNTACAAGVHGEGCPTRIIALGERAK